MLHIVITGCGRGIGFRLVEAIAAADDAVVYAVTRSVAAVEPLAERYPARIVPIEYDLAELTKHDSGLSEIIGSHTDKVDILINNAGTLLNRPFESIASADIQKMFEVNYMAPALLIRSLMPMLRRTHGHVVNIAGMGGFQGSVKFGGLSHYSASKAALAVLTECLAAEYSDVSFNALALGAVQTEMLQEAFPGYKAPIDARQAAEFISDFARNGHRYFNGKILPVSLSTP